MEENDPALFDAYKTAKAVATAADFLKQIEKKKEVLDSLEKLAQYTYVGVLPRDYRKGLFYRN